jgi:light-regulated signal transduction histidine kinase (bacteriophytochrome)
MLNGFFIFEPIINELGKLIDVRFLEVNPSFELQTGIRADEIIGKTWIEAFKYPNQDLSIYHNILYSGEGEHFETYYMQGNIYYLVNAFKIADNKVGVVFDNITEYKQAIKQITMLNEELEKRVVQRTNELQAAINELEAFAYTVSHDLKSPLRAIDGYSRIILEDFGANLEEDGNEMIHNIRNICRDMIEMINKLLKYSVTIKTDIDKEHINIEEMFKIIFNELKLEHKDRSIKLIIETGLPHVFADKVMFRQVIYNILSNAIKFTKYKEKALITVGCTITGDEYIFYVSDNGAGFDMDFSWKLFSIFERLHTSDEFEGSGIGLVTVKKIIQKHGGRVWIEGKLEKGATVYFTLPIEWQRDI